MTPPPSNGVYEQLAESSDALKSLMSRDACRAIDARTSCQSSRSEQLVAPARKASYT